MTRHVVKTTILNSESQEEAIKSLSKSPGWLVAMVVIMVFLSGARFGYQESKSSMTSIEMQVIANANFELLEALGDKFGKHQVEAVISRLHLK